MSPRTRTAAIVALSLTLLAGYGAGQHANPPMPGVRKVIELLTDKPARRLPPIADIRMA